VKRYRLVSALMLSSWSIKIGMWVETSAVGGLLTLKACVGTGNTHKDF
jgi:hypothetical protein